MDPKANYTLVGLFVIVLSIALAISALWLSGTGHDKRYHIYLVYMNEGVSGLNLRSAVKFNGVQVGYVNDISLNKRDPQQVRLELYIQDGTPITESTRAQLMSQGITGLAYVGLKAETPKAPVLTAKPGEPYPVIQSKPSLLFALDKALTEVTNNINSLTESVKDVFDEDNKRNLRDSLQNIKVVSGVLSENAKEINQSIKAADKFLGNAAEASVDLPATVKELRKALNSVDEMAMSLKKTGDAGSQAARGLAQETIPSATELIQRLNRIAVHVEQLSKELASNPSVVIRGKLPPPPGPGE